MITEKELIPLKFDLVFKRVFGDKNDLQPIRCLLKRILNIESIQMCHFIKFTISILYTLFFVIIVIILSFSKSMKIHKKRWNYLPSKAREPIIITSNINNTKSIAAP